MIYLNKNKIKKKIIAAGFRSSEGFLSQLDVLIDIILLRAIEYTRPNRTVDRDALLGYMTKHNIK